MFRQAFAGFSEDGSKQLADLRRISCCSDTAVVQNTDLLFGRPATRVNDGAGVTHAFSGRRRYARDKADHGFGHVVSGPLRRNFFIAAADFADHDHGVRLRIVVKEFEHINVLEAVDRIAADAYGRRLSKTEIGTLRYSLIGERS